MLPHLLSAIESLFSKPLFDSKSSLYRSLKTFMVWQRLNSESFILTHLFPMHPCSLPPEDMMFSGGRERVHWEQMG